MNKIISGVLYCLILLNSFGIGVGLVFLIQDQWDFFTIISNTTGMITCYTVYTMQKITGEFEMNLFEVKGDSLFVKSQVNGKYIKVTGVFYSEKETNEFLENHTDQGVVYVIKSTDKKSYPIIYTAKNDDKGITL